MNTAYVTITLATAPDGPVLCGRRRPAPRARVFYNIAFPDMSAATLALMVAH